MLKVRYDEGFKKGFESAMNNVPKKWYVSTCDDGLEAVLQRAFIKGYEAGYAEGLEKKERLSRYSK